MGHRPIVRNPHLYKYSDTELAARYGVDVPTLREFLRGSPFVRDYREIKRQRTRVRLYPAAVLHWMQSRSFTARQIANTWDLPYDYVKRRLSQATETAQAIDAAVAARRGEYPSIVSLQIGYQT